MLDSQVSTTFIFDATDQAAQRLTKAQEVFNSMKPDGGPHPMGPPRHLLYLALLEAAIARYEANTILLGDYKKLFDNASARLDAIRELVKAIGSETLNLDVLKHFVLYATFKPTRDKAKAVLAITPMHQRIMDSKLQPVGLHGAQAGEIFDICLYAFGDERQHGPAPAGSLERAFSKGEQKERDV